VFAKTLARFASLLPGRIKYVLKPCKNFYTHILSLGQPVVEITTRAGRFRWRIDPLTSQRHLLGEYEPYMQDCFAAYVREGDTVYDVGAHVGFHTLILGLMVKQGRVISFEPWAQSRRSLETQVELNPHLRIKVLACALSDRCGVVNMQTASDTSQCHVTEKGGVPVESKTIDCLVFSGEIPPPAVIKLDVEGHELAVLKGALSTLRQYRPTILCDYNDERTLPSLTALLAPEGYAVKPGPPIVAEYRVH
jgi:FkbM family methyltransferase